MTKWQIARVVLQLACATVCAYVLFFGGPRWFYIFAVLDMFLGSLRFAWLAAREQKEVAPCR